MQRRRNTESSLQIVFRQQYTPVTSARRAVAGTLLITHPPGTGAASSTALDCESFPPRHATGRAMSEKSEQTNSLPQRILVVDDNAMNREMLVSGASHWGPAA